MDDPLVEPEGQGHQVKKCDIRHHLTGLRVILEVRGHMGQGQRSLESRSLVKKSDCCPRDSGPMVLHIAYR